MANFQRIAKALAAVTLASVRAEQSGWGPGTGMNSTTAEATAGGGVKACGFSVKRRRARVRHCVSTASRP